MPDIVMTSGAWGHPASRVVETNLRMQRSLGWRTPSTQSYDPVCRSEEPENNDGGDDSTPNTLGSRRQEAGYPKFGSEKDAVVPNPMGSPFPYIN